MRWIYGVALCGLAGCGGDPEDYATLVSVTGTITKNGKPMPDAAITFLPEAGNKYRTPGSDSSGPEGNYKLMFKGRSGISPGKYKVSIESPFELPDGVTMPEAFSKDPFMFKKALEARKVAQKTTSTKKAVAAKSEFEAEVTDKGGVFDFDVKAAGSPAK